MRGKGFLIVLLVVVNAKTPAYEELKSIDQSGAEAYWKEERPRRESLKDRSYITKAGTIYNYFTSPSENAGLNSRSAENSASEEDDSFILPRRNDLKALNAFLNEKIPVAAGKLRGQELVDYVNQKQNFWTAKLNRQFSRHGDNFIKKLMGVKTVGNSIEARKNLAKSRFLTINLPENFDAREQWPNCETIKIVRDQSSCGSCWAFGAVEAMSDRLCISSGGKIQVSLSADDLLSCCFSCGFGCNGGDPYQAWRFYVKNGIVTGSNYTLAQGCRPYPFSPCEHHSTKKHFEPCPHDIYPTPSCEKKCQNGYNKDYKEDKHYGKTYYAVDNKVEAIQNELYTNGPLEVSFEVYEDFINYKSGIYVHTAGKLEGGHAVKLIGWGVDNGIPYWLIVNSWNSDWGEDGLFRIIRGKNECGIEEGVVGGLPDIKKSLRRFRDVHDFVSED